MTGNMLEFPIDGRAVCKLLSDSAAPNDAWVMRSIETLGDSSLLGDLWRRANEGEVVISTRNLCDALVFASQVITLDARLWNDASSQLYIEDGTVFVNSLPKAIRR